ncbi:MAG TPA: response regulator transcription factor [Acetobacteraceae bacterium]|jgi:DNA-binding response OmpR family regulator|nr:response regulator transcription factor [Acetobacteraceae bacterium]
MAAERPILIVDDDVDFRQMLKTHLELDGQFAATAVATLVDAAVELNSRDSRFDAVILDVQLPDGNGPDFCARLRELGKKMPIILLTGFDSERDLVRGLDAGANDYIVKPFRVNEFQARLRAQLRTFENSEHAVFTIGPYDFRPSTKLLQVRTDRRRIRLTEKEASILKYLYRAGSETVARPELLNEVWGYNATVTTHTLETHIYRLRQKMEYDPTDARILITERGGYRLDPNPRLPGSFVF